MTDTDTHSSAIVVNTWDGLMKDPLVANKLGLLMWSTEKIHKERLADQLSTMEKRPHDNPVLAAQGHMQYKWFKSNMTEQKVVKK